MSDTWMPLYVGDYLSATTRLTTEQHGAYFLLLLDYWKNGPPPNDDAVLAQIAHLSPGAWRKAKPALIGFFTVEGDKLLHKRVDKERSKAAGLATRARAGGKGKWGDADADRGRHLRSQRMTEARKKGTHTPQEWEALVEYCGSKCVRCGADGKLAKDHIQPIYQGGSDGIENLQPLCGSCNSSKGPETTDCRPNGWEKCLLNGVKMPAKCQLDACTSPSPSQGSTEPIASTNVDVSAEADPPTEKPLTKQEVIEAWQTRMVPLGFPAIRRLTGQRERLLRARLKDSTLDEWQQAMSALERSAFCRGENPRGWRADFDFLLQPKSFTGLLEGKYEH